MMTPNPTGMPSVITPSPMGVPEKLRIESDEQDESEVDHQRQNGQRPAQRLARCDQLLEFRIFFNF